MFFRIALSSLCVLGVLCGETYSVDPGPWATYRGNPQRTGNTDKQPGPDKPAVLWAIKSQDHFIAAPVPVGDKLCVTADTGKPIWQLPLPGDLIHLEGGPTIANNRVFMGGGAAGIMCYELDKAMLDGKELDCATILKMQDAKWKELQAAYEKEKKVNPDLAIEPSDDQLLKPVPKKVWQVGAVKWHSDAPVNLTGDKLLAPTAFLDKEKVGERALYCLNAATGDTIWKREL